MRFSVKHILYMQGTGAVQRWLISKEIDGRKAKDRNGRKRIDDGWPNP